MHESINRITHDSINRITHDSINRITHDSINNIIHDTISYTRFYEIQILGFYLVQPDGVVHPADVRRSGRDGLEALAEILSPVFKGRTIQPVGALSCVHKREKSRITTKKKLFRWVHPSLYEGVSHRE